MIIGTTALEDALERLSNAQISEAIKGCISYVQEAAKANCPVNDGELRQSIHTDVTDSSEKVTGACYTNKAYAPYVEFGTGPKGQADHAGISPDVAVAYTQSPWWIHESQIGREVAERYHFFCIDAPQGRFYLCTGQSAQPFMYQALKNNEDEIMKMFAEEVKKQL